MNEMINSSPWPKVPTSRINMNEYFNFSPMNAWQPPSTTTTDLYSPEDYNNVWSAKNESIDENDNKESIWNTIWSTNASTSISSVDSTSLASDGSKKIEETPTNSPSLKRSEIINSNDRWGSVKINQLSKWSIVEMDESDRQPHDPMVWRAKVDGTEAWEDYYVRQHGRRQPQAEGTFNGDCVWSGLSEASVGGGGGGGWQAKAEASAIQAAATDTFVQGSFTEAGGRASGFVQPQSSNGGVRPSMTRNQAQKYLIDMGYSLSDAIGALVNNQMDLPKAISELQSKYRVAPGGGGGGGGGGAHGGGPYGGTYNGGGGGGAGSVRSGEGPAGGAYGRLAPPCTPLGHHMLANPGGGGGFQGGPFALYQDQQEALMQCSDGAPMYPDSGSSRPSDHKRMQSYVARSPSSTAGAGAANMAIMMGSRLGGGGGGYQDLGNSQQMNAAFGRMGLGGYQGGGGGVYGGGAQKWPPQQPAMLSNGRPKQQQQARMPTWMDAETAGLLARQGHKDAMAHGLNGSAPTTVVVRNVTPHHLDVVRAMCLESGTITSFQLQAHTQCLLVQFQSAGEARRCSQLIQGRLRLRADLLDDDFSPVQCAP